MTAPEMIERIHKGETLYLSARYLPALFDELRRLERRAVLRVTVSKGTAEIANGDDCK